MGINPSITNSNSSFSQITQRIQRCHSPLRMDIFMSRQQKSEEHPSLESLLILNMVLSLTTKSLKQMPLNQNQICYGAVFGVSCENHFQNSSASSYLSSLEMESLHKWF